MNDSTHEPLEPGELDRAEIPAELALLVNPLFVLYPSMIAPLLVQDEAAMRLVDDVLRGPRMIGVFAPRPEPSESGGNGRDFFGKIYEVGTAAVVLRMLKIPDGTLRLLVRGIRRIRISEPIGLEPYPRARIEAVDEIVTLDNETEALKKNAREMLASIVQESGSLPDDLIIAANNMDHPGRLADLIAANISIPREEQQQILEIAEAKGRLLRVQQIMSRELEIAKLGSKIQSEVKTNMDRVQKDFVLREQLKAIRRELGEEGEAGEELDQLYEQIKKAGMPEHAFQVASKEINRLRTMSTASAEYTVSRTYVDWLAGLPWSKSTRDNIDLKKARKVLDADHYDLEKIKERILEYLAVIKLRKAIRGPILCLVGPPGVGKTSLGRSIARSMGRKFARMSLGGMRDEAEIRGHRRTYIGAMPGRIIKCLKDAGANNPVVMLDEIDKLGMDFRGDPASALLEVLDPEQNFSFTDHYLDMPFDLSNVMFITTANTLDTIPSPLLDRMEVLTLSGYTLTEKVHIARQYLIPRALESTGLKPRQVQFTDSGIESVIERYTREAGLRNLEREIANICRKVARRVAEGEQGRVTVDPDHVGEALGPPRFDRDELGDRTREPGVAVGLAWTPTGGDILFIEATATPGQGRLVLTGKLGDVMKESVQAARTWLHAQSGQFGLSQKLFNGRDLHVHVPAGAIPKDGPSAGVAMLTAMASLLAGRPARNRLAMTGEITIKGAVLPVGGIKEKILAAHRSGIRSIILPRRNRKDLIDVPEEVRDALQFHYVDHAEQVLSLVFDPPLGKVGRRVKKAGGATEKSRNAKGASPRRVLRKGKR